MVTDEAAVAAAGGGRRDGSDITEEDQRLQRGGLRQPGQQVHAAQVL